MSANTGRLPDSSIGSIAALHVKGDVITSPVLFIALYPRYKADLHELVIKIYFLPVNFLKYDVISFSAVLPGVPAAAIKSVNLKLGLE